MTGLISICFLSTSIITLALTGLTSLPNWSVFMTFPLIGSFTFVCLALLKDAKYREARTQAEQVSRIQTV